MDDDWTEQVDEVLRDRWGAFEWCAFAILVGLIGMLFAFPIVTLAK